VQSARRHGLRELALVLALSLAAAGAAVIGAGDEVRAFFGAPPRALPPAAVR
jgi:hypothetical protein